MNFKVEPNDTVPYEIRHADSRILVVEKPPHVVTQPGKKHEDDSLLNALFCNYGNQLNNLGASRNWGLLHRLDKDTSGLVIVALQNAAYASLREQFEKRTIRKRYWCIVKGLPRKPQGVIQKPIAEIVGSRKRAVVKRDGKTAITSYQVLHSTGEASLVEARPKTGRLHQIRVHMSEMGHPIYGDPLYGDRQATSAVRLCLHAAELSFLHPETGHRLTVKSDWPKDLRKTLKRLELPDPTDVGR